MKFISYLQNGHDRLGVLIGDLVYDMEVLHPDLPNSMGLFLNYWEESNPIVQAGELMLREGERVSDSFLGKVSNKGNATAKKRVKS